MGILDSLLGFAKREGQQTYRNITTPPPGTPAAQYVNVNTPAAQPPPQQRVQQAQQPAQEQQQRSIKERISDTVEVIKRAEPAITKRIESIPVVGKQTASAVQAAFSPRQTFEKVSSAYGDVQAKVSEQIPTIPKLQQKTEEFLIANPRIQSVLGPAALKLMETTERAVPESVGRPVGEFSVGFYEGLQEKPVTTGASLVVGGALTKGAGIIAKVPGATKTIATIGTAQKGVQITPLTIGAGGMGAVYGADVYGRISQPVLTGEYERELIKTETEPIEGGYIETQTFQETPIVRDPTFSEKMRRLGGITSTELAPMTLGGIVATRGLPIDAIKARMADVPKSVTQANIKTPSPQTGLKREVDLEKAIAPQDILSIGEVAPIKRMFGGAVKTELKTDITPPEWYGKFSRVEYSPAHTPIKIGGQRSEIRLGKELPGKTDIVPPEWYGKYTEWSPIQSRVQIGEQYSKILRGKEISPGSPIGIGEVAPIKRMFGGAVKTELKTDITPPEWYGKFSRVEYSPAHTPIKIGGQRSEIRLGKELPGKTMAEILEVPERPSLFPGGWKSDIALPQQLKTALDPTSLKYKRIKGATGSELLKRERAVRSPLYKRDLSRSLDVTTRQVTGKVTVSTDIGQKLRQRWKSRAGELETQAKKQGFSVTSQGQVVIQKQMSIPKTSALSLQKTRTVDLSRDLVVPKASLKDALALEAPRTVPTSLKQVAPKTNQKVLAPVRSLGTGQKPVITTESAFKIMQTQTTQKTTQRTGTKQVHVPMTEQIKIQKPKTTTTTRTISELTPEYVTDIIPRTIPKITPKTTTTTVPRPPDPIKIKKTKLEEEVDELFGKGKKKKDFFRTRRKSPILDPWKNWDEMAGTKKKRTRGKKK